MDWSFIPPYSPNFGGLWKAEVKSTKYHLRRVIGNQQLTFEQMTTLLCEVETCLNSRPLSSISNDSTDLLPLTPGHFLTGRPITTAPEPGFPANSSSPHSIWRRISQMKFDFWRKWQREYLHQLQARRKWEVQRDGLQPGMLVLIVDDHTPLCQVVYGTSYPGSSRPRWFVQSSHSTHLKGSVYEANR